MQFFGGLSTSSLLPASAKKLSSRQQPLHCEAVNRAAAILLAILSSQWCTREKAIRTAAVDRENVAQTLQRTFPTAKDREEKRDEVREIETTDEEFGKEKKVGAPGWLVGPAITWSLRNEGVLRKGQMPKCFNGGPSYPLQENKSHDNTRNSAWRRILAI